MRSDRPAHQQTTRCEVGAHDAESHDVGGCLDQRGDSPARRKSSSQWSVCRSFRVGLLRVVMSPLSCGDPSVHIGIEATTHLAGRPPAQWPHGQ